MKRYQLVAMTSQGQINHAGVHQLGNISHRTIEKIERKWQLWRREYIAQHEGTYPLKEDTRLSKYIAVYPIGDPKNQRIFTL